MATFQISSFNLQMAQNYFANLNPLAQRIASDINATKSTYGHLWNTLNTIQQNEIINETLINTKIASNYSEKVSLSSPSLSTNSSSSSLMISTTSADNILHGLSKSGEPNYSPSISITTNLLPDNIIQQTNNLLSKTLNTRAKQTVRPHQLIKMKPPSSPPPPPPITTNKYTKAKGRPKSLRNYVSKTTKEKSFFFYDGSNLHTYSAQKVALKIIYDDVMGAYRDEHSQPFSYRTKSQIDLQEQYYETDLDDVNSTCDSIFLISKEPYNVNLVGNTLTKNYKQLQKELKNTLNNHLDTIRKNQSSYVNHDISSKDSFNNNDDKRFLTISQEVTKFTSAELTQAYSSQTSNKSKIKGSNYLRENNEEPTSEGSFKMNFKPEQTNLNDGVCSDVYYEQGESATLMHNCSNSGNLTASSNSSISTSDEDDHNNYEYDDDDDEKTHCEDIRLLENELNLRRGFDFLNNW